MGLNLGVMSAAVTLDVSQYRRNLSGLENESDKSFQRIAKAATGYLTVRSLFGFASGAMAEFSKLEEGNNKLKYTFSEVRSAAEKTAKQIEKTYNIAPQTAINAIADIGDMLTGFGFIPSSAFFIYPQPNQQNQNGLYKIRNGLRNKLESVFTSQYNINDFWSKIFYSKLKYK